MLTITKIFNFEMAHAIGGYEGACKYIHGHSYQLHVSVATFRRDDDPMPAPGFVLDFKTLKTLVQERVVRRLDHMVVLSSDYLEQNPGCRSLQNLVVWDMEPSAENMLLYMRRQIGDRLPAGTQLQSLRLYETAASYAEWTAV